MPERSPARRFALLLVIALVVLLQTCKSTGWRGRIPNVETFCTHGNHSPSKPLICVDENKLTSDPDPVRVFDVEADHEKSTGRPVVVYWFSQRTADIRVDFGGENACVTDLKCEGGHCSATVKSLNGSQKPRQCKYTLWNGKHKSDPDFIVNPCCWVENP